MNNVFIAILTNLDADGKGSRETELNYFTSKDEAKEFVKTWVDSKIAEALAKEKRTLDDVMMQWGRPHAGMDDYACTDTEPGKDYTCYGEVWSPQVDGEIYL